MTHMMRVDPDAYWNAVRNPRVDSQYREAFAQAAADDRASAPVEQPAAPAFAGGNDGETTE